MLLLCMAPITKVWTAMEAEKESYVADEGETKPLLEMSNIFIY